MLVSSLEEKNIMKASFDDISNALEVYNKEVQSVLDLSYISNDIVKIAQEAQGEDTNCFLRWQSWYGFTNYSWS